MTNHSKLNYKCKQVEGNRNTNTYVITSNNVQYRYYVHIEEHDICTTCTVHRHTLSHTHTHTQWIYTINGAIPAWRMMIIFHVYVRFICQINSSWNQELKRKKLHWNTYQWPLVPSVCGWNYLQEWKMQPWPSPDNNKNNNHTCYQTSKASISKENKIN